MSVSDQDILELIKTQIRQSRLLANASVVLADQACLIVRTLEICGRCEKDVITVEHAGIGVQACDRCAAEMIVRAARNFVTGYSKDPKDPFNEVRLSVMDENMWQDTEDAERIRRLVTYVNIVKSDSAIHHSRVTHH